MSITLTGLSIGVLLTIAGTFAGIISQFTKLKSDFENLEKEYKEEKEELKANIKELYNSRNDTNAQIIKISTILENMADKLTTLDRKIDDLKKELQK